jgi:hypothetical protein
MGCTVRPLRTHSRTPTATSVTPVEARSAGDTLVREGRVQPDRESAASEPIAVHAVARSRMLLHSVATRSKGPPADDCSHQAHRYQFIIITNGPSFRQGRI